MRKLAVVFCCSGGLGKIAFQQALRMRFVDIKLVLTDKRSDEIIKMAQQNKIPFFMGNPRLKDVPTTRYDVLASANYLFVLPAKLLTSAKILAFNIHGSLLPKYMGRTPVTWAIINDEVETGITAHEMVADVDAGPILFQKKIRISNKETGGGLLRKMALSYPSVLSTVLNQIKDGKIEKAPQDLQKKTYFGKREPADGLIDWRWSSRKIYNWIRAQTRPYPGAFGFIDGVKYRIWKAEEYPCAITQVRCGAIIPGRNGPIIKCGQAAIKLLDYSTE